MGRGHLMPRTKALLPSEEGDPDPQAPVWGWHLQFFKSNLLCDLGRVISPLWAPPIQ